MATYTRYSLGLITSPAPQPKRTFIKWAHIIYCVRVHFGACKTHAINPPLHWPFPPQPLPNPHQPSDWRNTAPVLFFIFSIFIPGHVPPGPHLPGHYIVMCTCESMNACFIISLSISRFFLFIIFCWSPSLLLLLLPAPPPPLPKEKTHNLNASFSSPLIGAAFTLLTRSPGDIVFPNPSGWFFGAHNISLLFRWSPPPYVWIVCNMS